MVLQFSLNTVYVGFEVLPVYLRKQITSDNVLFLGDGTVWVQAVLSMFWSHVLPLLSWLNCAVKVSLYVCVHDCVRGHKCPYVCVKVYQKVPF